MQYDRNEPSTAPWVALILSVPLVYAISVFPVALICETFGLNSPPDWVLAIYQPLFKFVLAVPWLKDLYTTIFEAMGL